MIQFTPTFGRTVRRVSLLALPLLVAAPGTVAAHGGGGYDGGMMGGGWGLFGGAMGLWGLLWMGILIAVPLLVVYSVRNDGPDGGDERSMSDERPMSVLRERYARGELSDEEFDRRRTQLEHTG